MKKTALLFVLISYASIAQVGIGTTDPKGALDVSSTNLGLVLPRVTQLEDVTNNNAGLAEDGTIVYDVSRNKTCFRVSSKWICIANDASLTETVVLPAPLNQNNSENHSNTNERKTENNVLPKKDFQQ